MKRNYLNKERNTIQYNIQYYEIKRMIYPRVGEKFVGKISHGLESINNLVNKVAMSNKYGK